MISQRRWVDAIPTHSCAVIGINEILLAFLHVIGHHHFRRERFEVQPVHCAIDVIESGSDAVIVIPNHDVLLNRHDSVHVIRRGVVDRRDNRPVLETLDHDVLHRNNSERLGRAPVAVGERCLSNRVPTRVFNHQISTQSGVGCYVIVCSYPRTDSEIEHHVGGRLGP